MDHGTCVVGEGECSKTGSLRTGWCIKHYKRVLKYGDPQGQAPAQVIPDLPGERWLPVVDWEDCYHVSDLGRVRSLSRPGHPGRLLKQFVTGQYGYLGVKLWSGDSGVTVYVQHLVLTAFVEPRPEGMECCHGPGGAQDNRLVNLTWDTKAKNEQDKSRDRTSRRGEVNHFAKITWEIAAEIRRRRAATGERQASLAARFNVSQPSVSMILAGKTWRPYDQEPQELPGLFDAAS